MLSSGASRGQLPSGLGRFFFFFSCNIFFCVCVCMKYNVPREKCTKRTYTEAKTCVAAFLRSRNRILPVPYIKPPTPPTPLPSFLALCECLPHPNASQNNRGWCGMFLIFWWFWTLYKWNHTLCILWSFAFFPPQDYVYSFSLLCNNNSHDIDCLSPNLFIHPTANGHLSCCEFVVINHERHYCEHSSLSWNT